MRRYSQTIISKTRQLRALGKTYQEIRLELNEKIPKSTLSEWCSKVSLPPEYEEKIQELNKVNRHKGRVTAFIVNKIKREKLMEEIKKVNEPISTKIRDLDTAKIALSMLCLGEASKSSGAATSLSLGNSDPRIILLFLKLLRQCFETFSIEKIRCTVQCRADQDIALLEEYWRKITGIPAKLFYKAQIDPRTIGKPTKKKEYKGVLRIDYFDNRVWHELETLADLVYNLNSGPVA